MKTAFWENLADNFLYNWIRFMSDYFLDNWVWNRNLLTHPFLNGVRNLDVFFNYLVCDIEAGKIKRKSTKAMNAVKP